MKKGILFKLLVAVLVLAVLAGSFFVLFSIRTFEFEVKDSYGAVTETDLQAFCVKYKSKNIIAFSESQFEDEIERAFPYIDVLNVERVFPSSVKVVYTERVSIYAINLDSKYYLYNIEGYLLEISDKNLGSGGSYPCIELSGLTIPENVNFELGKITQIEGLDAALSAVRGLFDAMTRMKTPYSALEIKSFIKDVSVSREIDLEIQTRYGIVITIYNAKDNLANKVNYVIQAYASGFATEPDSHIYIGDDLIPKLA